METEAHSNVHIVGFSVGGSVQRNIRERLQGIRAEGLQRAGVLRLLQQKRPRHHRHPLLC